jgi:hypothetical protein
MLATQEVALGFSYHEDRLFDSISRAMSRAGKRLSLGALEIFHG